MRFTQSRSQIIKGEITHQCCFQGRAAGVQGIQRPLRPCWVGSSFLSCKSTSYSHNRCRESGPLHIRCPTFLQTSWKSNFSVSLKQPQAPPPSAPLLILVLKQNMLRSTYALWHMTASVQSSPTWTCQSHPHSTWSTSEIKSQWCNHSKVFLIFVGRRGLTSGYRLVRAKELDASRTNAGGFIDAFPFPCL